MKTKAGFLECIFCLMIVTTVLLGCSQHPLGVYHDQNMDFGAVQTVAVMPFVNLTRDNVAAERVRDIFINRLLATEALYVLPIGEVARGVAKVEIQNPASPSPDEIVKLGAAIKAQAIVTGSVREYGEVRAGTTSANVVSASIQMMETQTGKIVFSSSSSQGGITLTDRLFGGGGEPMEKVTEKSVDDLIKKMFK
jgi:polysaccharide biosynthesis protein PelC